MTVTFAYTHVFVVLFAVAGAALNAAIALPDDAPFTATDAVNAEWYVDVKYGVPVRGQAGESSLSSHIFSPNGRNAIFLTRKGNLRTNAQCMTLHIVTLTANGLNHRALSRLCSKTNNPAISDVRWLTDNRVAFLGSEGSKAPQIMSVDVHDCTLTRHTEGPEDKSGFDMNADEIAVFGVIPAAHASRRPDNVGPGYIVQNETLSDIIGLERYPGHRPTYYYIADKGGMRRIRGIQTQYSFSANFISVSPSGLFAVVATAPRTVPAEWSKLPITPKVVSGATVHWSHVELVLIELDTNARYAISGGPMGFPRNKFQIIWNERNNRMFVLDQFLGTQQSAHLSGTGSNAPALFAFSLDTKRPTRLIAHTPMSTASSDSHIEISDAEFDATNGTLTVQRGKSVTQYQESENGWRGTDDGDNLVQEAAFTLTVDQYADRPAQMFATLPSSGERIAIGEINTNLKRKANPAHVYSWTDKTGKPWKAGLILPNDAPHGTALPLIIQTHAFSIHEFVITGLRGSSAGFSGQALASAGFAVLNVGPQRKELVGSEGEFKVMSEGFRSAIAALAGDAVIDPKRVGVIVWSRSGLWLQHALAFQDNLFAAAIVSDAGTFGKFNYLFMENTVFQSDTIKQNGVTPFGTGLDIWRERDPVTHVEAFTVPLRLNDFDKRFPVWWEAYVAMKRAGEPVEYYHLPTASHNPVQPEHQLWVQSTTIDWFRFWLMGEESTNPLDSTQYARWQKMRDEKCLRLAGEEDSTPFYCQHLIRKMFERVESD